MCMVSVIVPVYQVEAYLPRCLDSLLAQTLTDFEMILVDDGTRDGCPAIMETYAARDARIRLIRKENGGLSSARNAGLDVAHGKYVAFVDSDDVAKPNLLSDTVDLAERTGAELVVFNYERFGDCGDEGPYLVFSNETIDLDRLSLSEYLYRYWLSYKHGQEAWSKLWRRDVIECNHLRFAPNEEIFAEDTLFSAMYLMHTHTIAAQNAAHIRYFQHTESIMGREKPYLCRRLTTLAIRLWDYARVCGRERELRNALTVFCYDKLICKGIKQDENPAQVQETMMAFAENTTLCALLRSLASPMPLLLYTLKTGKGLRSQLTGRLFAMRWLRGDVQGALRLVRRQEDV